MSIGVIRIYLYLCQVHSNDNNLKIEISNIEKIKHELSLSESIVITTHRMPDGDAVGSSLGLYNLLRKKGCNVTVIMPDNYPEYLHWLKGDDEVVIFSANKDKAIQIIKNADIIFCLDYNDLSRIEKLEPYIKSSCAKKIIIDHHPDPTDFADYIISDTTVSSAAELIYEFIIKAGYDDLIDEPIAECLFVGIMTDTGSFTYNSFDPRTYEIIARLLSYGIDKNKIYSNVYDNFSEDRMRLLGYCLDKKMVVIPEYRTAYISITKKELKKYKFITGDSEGFVNYPLSVKGILFSAIFIEKDDRVKTSFRSKGNFEVNKFAEKHFNGGGHKNAAGGETPLPLEAAIKKFTELLPEYANGLKY